MFCLDKTNAYRGFGERIAVFANELDRESFHWLSNAALAAARPVVLEMIRTVWKHPVVLNWEKSEKRG